MGDTLDLHKTIIHGLQGLPESSLREIAEYIFFIRQKALQPDQFRAQFEASLLVEGLSALRTNEMQHLEEELKGYKEQYPKE